MIRRSKRSLLGGLLVSAVAAIAGTAPASAAITPTNDADAVSLAAVAQDTLGAVQAAGFDVAPPNGNYAAVSDSDLALFPVNGPNYAILSTGDTTQADQPNSAPDSSTVNGGGGAGHGGQVNDLVTLRIDLQVPQASNCLTIDFRFLTEEFPEFIGSQYNDAFLAEVDANDFTVANDGKVSAPSNFALDPDGRTVTVNAVGTSADNALGTTYDGASPVLRATTPITPGAHSVYLSIYDANDSIYDSSVFVDNLRLRTAKASNCTKGSAPNGEADDLCVGKKPTIFASAGFATGTKGDDVIQGSNADDVIRGKGGNDLICGGPGDDKIYGQDGNDRIQGNTGKDLLKGNSGNDRLDGNRGDDVVKGQADGDQVKGSGGDDSLFGGTGDDVLLGGQGNDLLQGRGDNDRLNGGRDDDRLRGGKGKDRCKPGKGKDKVSGC